MTQGVIDAMSHDKPLRWETYVPLFKNRFVLTGLALAVGLPFGLLIGLLLLVSNGDIAGIKYALLMIGLLFALTFLFLMLVYGGKYAPGFIVDARGITNYTQAHQQKKNRVVNALLVACGMFSGNPTAAGIGLSAGARTVMTLKWPQIRKVTFYPSRHAILVRGGFAQKMAVFCTRENYAQAEATIRRRLGL